MAYAFENEGLKKAVDEIIFTYVNENVELYEAHAQKLMAYVSKLTDRRKVKDLYAIKGVNDVLLASAYLYKVFFKDDQISTLFLLREKTRDIFDKHQVDKGVQDKIFQMCECHMGEDSLADFLIPQKGYPDDLFADAIYIMSLKVCHCEKATKCI